MGVLCDKQSKTSTKNLGWLRKGNLKRETKSLLRTALNNARRSMSEQK